MAERLSHEDLRKRVAHLEGALEKFSLMEQANRTRLDYLEKVKQFDDALLGTSDPEVALLEALGRAQKIFQCDRVWLLFPCDPDAPSWSVPFERATPEFPGAKERFAGVPMTADVAEMLRNSLKAPGPVVYGPGGLPLVEGAESWRIRSLMSMAVRPGTGRPWQFGIHQCSYPRSWSPEEKALFRDIGYRIARTLNATLSQRRLRLSEKEAQEGLAILEERLRNSSAELSIAEGRLKAILESLPFDFFALDSEGRYSMQNSLCRRKWGDVLGKTPAEAAGSRELAEIWESNNRRAFAGETVINEASLTIAGEEKVYRSVVSPIRSGQEIAGILGINIDLTELRRNEKALDASRANFEAVFRSITEAAVFADLSRRIVAVNPAFERLWGYSAGEVLGRTTEFLYASPEDFERLGRECYHADSAGTEKPFRVTYRRREGSLFLGESLGTQVRNTRGEVIGYAAIHRDVTESTRSLELLQAQQELASKLAATHLLDDGVKACLEASLKVSGMEAGGVYLFDAGARNGRLMAHENLSPELAAKMSEFLLDPTPESSLQRGEPLFEARGDLPAAIRSALDEEGFVALAVVPIVHDARVIGCINVFSRSILEVSSQSRQALRSVADQMGNAVARLTFQEALGESEEKYRLLTENNPDAIVLGDDQGRVLEANPAACRMFGYSLDEFRRLNRRDLHFPDDPEYRRIVAARKEKGYYRGETTLKRKDETSFPGELIINVYNDREGRERVIGLLRDITERREFINLLRAQNELAIALSSLNSLRQGLELCLETACRISGMEAGGIYLLEEEKGTLDLACTRNLAQDFVDRVRSFPLDSHYGGIVTAGKPIFTNNCDGNEIIRRTLDSAGLKALAILPIFHQGRPIGCMHVSSKHTVEVSAYAREVLCAISAQIGSAVSRLRGAKALRESEERYRNLVDRSQEFIFTMSLDGRFTFVNKALEHLTDWKIEEWLGKPLSDFICPEDLPMFVERMRRIVQGEVLPGNEVRVFMKSGEVRECEYTTSALTKDGKIVGIWGLVLDITERKRAIRALRESEEKYRRLVATIPHGIAEVDSDGAIVFANSAFHRIFGYEEGELVGSFLNDLLPVALDGKTLREHAGDGVARPPSPAPWILATRRKDGLLIHVQVDWAYLGGEEGSFRGFSVITSDVSERRRALDALRESEEKFRTLAEESPNMIFIVRDDRILYVNRQSETLVGYRQDEMCGEGFCFTGLVAGEFRAKAEEAFDRIARGEVPPPCECALLGKGGERIDVLVAVRGVHFRGAMAVMGIATDISAQKRAQKALRQSEERYRGLVEQSKEVIFTLDRTGKFIFLNPAFAEKTGWAVEEWLGRKFTEIVSPEYHEDLGTRFEETMEGTNLPQNEVKIFTASGDLLDIEYTTVPMIVEGRSEGVWGIARDITARKQAEEYGRNLVALREREGVSRWLHDHLGADLYNILLISDSIARKQKHLPPAVSDQLEWISETSRTALTGIRNYLDFSTQLGSSFRSMAENMEKYGTYVITPLGMEFVFRREGDLTRCRLTGIQSFSLYLIYKEALTNIVKHARAGKVSVRLAALDDHLVLTVEDDGMGITLGGGAPGGLGTGNIRARARELGGNFTIENRPGGGTKLEISMPYS